MGWVRDRELETGEMGQAGKAEREERENGRTGELGSRERENGRTGGRDNVGIWESGDVGMWKLCGNVRMWGLKYKRAGK